MKRIPLVFVSSTTKDLASFRPVATQALLDRQIHPVVKEHFATSHENLNKYLHDQLKPCDAVILLAGFQFGQSPHEAGRPGRRSWTQMEYDFAVANDIPVVVFLADEKCPFDNPSNECEEGRESQNRFRRELGESGRKFSTFTSHDQLRELVLRIDFQTIFAHREGRTRRQRFAAIRKYTALGMLFLSLSGGLAAWRPWERPQLLVDTTSKVVVVGMNSMRIPVEIVYSAKVGDNYSPITIHSQANPALEYSLPEDLKPAREAYSLEQARKAEAKQPHSWNGPIFRLRGWDLTPTPEGRSKTLVLNIDQGEYFDFVITHLKMKEIRVADAAGREITAWEKYIEPHHLNFDGQPNPCLSNMFGVSLTAITTDGYAILNRRSKRNAVVPEYMHVSVAESTKAPDDAAEDRAMLVYNTAVRGLKEELCISGFDRRHIEFLALIHSRELAQFDVVGAVRLPYSKEDMSRKIAGCSDHKFENQRMEFVPFTPASIASFMQRESAWSPFAAASLLIALQYEFGTPEVDREFVKAFGTRPVELKEFRLLPQQ
jgi:hypothetical protein